MDLKQIEIFLKVAETKNFTKAAEELFVTQQSVSKRVAELEQELGVVLFERSTKKVELTDVGELAFYKLQRSVMMLEKSIAELKEYADGRKPLLRVGIYSGIRRQVQETVIKRICEIIPRSKVDITIVPHVGSMQNIDNGKVDLFFTYIDEMEKWSDYGHVYIKNVKTKIIVAKNHIWANAKRVEKRDLKKEIFVRYPVYTGTVEKNIYNTMPCLGVRERDGIESILHDVECVGGFTILPENDEIHQQFDVVELDLPFENTGYKMVGLYDKENANSVLKKVLKQISC